MNFSELKANAQEKLNGKRLNAALVVLVYFVIIGVINAVLSKIFPGQTTVYNTSFGEVSTTTTSPIASIIESCVSIFFALGLTSYYMKIARGEEASITELFSKGNIFLKVFVTSILTGFAILGGCILLIIPGIILAYAYSMINYIYIDNPQIGIVEVMKESRKIMKGHKMEFFLFGLSFLGWIILGLFTCGILYFWLMPYMGVATVNFYDKIKQEQN